MSETANYSSLIVIRVTEHEMQAFMRGEKNTYRLKYNYPLAPGGWFLFRSGTATAQALISDKEGLKITFHIHLILF